MIITDTTPERNMANIFNAIDTLKHYISLWGDNKVRRELERVLHIFEMDAFMVGKKSNFHMKMFNCVLTSGPFVLTEWKLKSVNILLEVQMRKFTVEEPIEKNRNNDIVVCDLLYSLFYKVMNNDVVKTGANASQVDGQSSYVELLAKTIQLDPYAPYIYLDKSFQTPKKYVKSELDWYKSMDLSIIGHEGIETNPTWQSCCTKDEKKEINSNYGWCVFSEENGSQYDNCLEVLKKDKTTRNAIIVYNRPEIYKDYKRDGMHDMICTMYSHFFIRNNKLYMVHNMRSNDIRYGFICSDLAWNCFVYQNMYEDLKSTYPDLEVGTIIWTSDSMHIYDRHYDDLKKFVESRQYFQNVATNNESGGSF